MPKEKDLFKNLREHSIAEFFRKNAQMLGYSGKIKSLTTVVHELVTNSLDACEENGVLPSITVQVMRPDDEVIVVRSKDNGPGIPKKHLSSVFGKMLAGTKFHRNIQLRGQQGIGVAGVTMFSQMTTGKPIEVISITKDDAWDIELNIDIRKNKADIVTQQKIETPPGETGVEYIGQFKEVQYSTTDQGPYEYLRRTALANPHAEITYIDPGGAKIHFPRTSEEIPKKPKEVQPHPKGMIVDDLVLLAKSSKNRTIKGMLQTELSRVSSAKAKQIQEMVDFDLGKSPKKIGWNEAEQLIKAFKKLKFLAPATDCLRPIGEEKIEKAMESILAPDFLAVNERKPTVYGGGYAFQVEVGVAYGGHSGRKLSSGEQRYEIMRFANRAPLLFDAGGCGLTKAVQAVDWKRYGIKDIEHSPVTVFINLISTHIPYTGAGKQSVSDSEEIVSEIRQALMEVGRKFNRFHSHKRKLEEHTVRKNKLLKYVTEITPVLADLLDRDKKELDKKWEGLVESHVGETIDDLQEKVDKQKAEREEEGEEETHDEAEENGLEKEEAIEEEKAGNLSDYM
jgi:DNA topoisomerase-6 subunit B